MLIKEAKNYGQQQKKLKQLKVDFFLKNFIDEEKRSSSLSGGETESVAHKNMVIRTPKRNTLLVPDTQGLEGSISEISRCTSMDNDLSEAARMFKDAPSPILFRSAKPKLLHRKFFIEAAMVGDQTRIDVPKGVISDDQDSSNNDQNYLKLPRVAVVTPCSGRHWSAPKTPDNHKPCAFVADSRIADAPSEDSSFDRSFEKLVTKSLEASSTSVKAACSSQGMSRINDRFDRSLLFDDDAKNKPKYRYINDPVRKKHLRRKLHGFNCGCCCEYFDALPLASSQKNDRINMVSRHRAVYVRDKSPPNFWDVGFPSTPELYSRGMILVKR